MVTSASSDTAEYIADILTFLTSQDKLMTYISTCTEEKDEVIFPYLVFLYNAMVKSEALRRLFVTVRPASPGLIALVKVFCQFRQARSKNT